MPRHARVILANVPLHLVQRGHNRQACFLAATDYEFYLACLQRAAELHGCLIHAYVLMTNHVHVVLTPLTTTAPARMMRTLNQQYVQYVNRKHGRSGTLWEGRYRSCLTQDDHYLLMCHRYVELNPVRAGMVAIPEAYRWSSYRANAYGDVNTLITRHAIFRSLGDTVERCQRAYRALFEHAVPADQAEQIRRATYGNDVLGSAHYLASIAKLIGRRVTPARPGPPPARDQDARQVE